MRLLLIILGIVILFSVLILTLSYVSPFSSTKERKNDVTTNTKLYFKPDIISSPCKNNTHSQEIFLDTQSNSVSRAQIELSYDPNLIYDLSVLPAGNSLLGDPEDYEVILNEAREEYGRASFAITRKTTSQENSGNKPIALVTFKTYSPVASSSSKITFLNKSTVQTARTRTSLLYETTPLTIICR